MVMKVIDFVDVQFVKSFAFIGYEKLSWNVRILLVYECLTISYADSQIPALYMNWS